MKQFVPTVGSVPTQPSHPIPYKLVPMNRELVPQIAEIERSCFSLPWTEEMLYEELESLNTTCIVAVTEEQEVLGYASLTVVLDEGYINNIAVRRPYRRIGLGSELLRVFERFSIANHLAFLTLEVRDTNLAARALYHSFGFEEVGRRKNYYEKPREDAILMTKYYNKEGTNP